MQLIKLRPESLPIMQLEPNAVDSLFGKRRVPDLHHVSFGLLGSDLGDEAS